LHSPEQSADIIFEGALKDAVDDGLNGSSLDAVEGRSEDAIEDASNIIVVPIISVKGVSMISVDDTFDDPAIASSMRKRWSALIYKFGRVASGCWSFMVR
jgi:hypothetical protein